MPVFIPRCWIELRTLSTEKIRQEQVNGYDHNNNNSADEQKKHSQFDMIMNGFLIHMIHIVIHLHYRRLVPTSVTIIRGRENSNYRSIVLPLISLHD